THLSLLPQEEAPPPRSVFELAKKFKGSPAAPNINTEKEAVKPIRRRPPRTLQIPKASGDEQPPPGLTSPLSSKPKRNSALIEKLQANLTLSPTGPPLKSPGVRATPLTFTPPSPGSALVSTVSLGSPTSPLSSPVIEEEGPASFEAPPSAAEGTILTSINKARARVSIRRRPPSRRHRKSSSGDEACTNQNTSDSQPNSRSEEEETATGGEERGGEEASQEDQTKSPPQEEEKMRSSVEEGAEEGAKEEAKEGAEEGAEEEEEEGEPPSGSSKEEEEKSSETQKEDSAEREPGNEEKEESQQ
uniref:CapZ-interacting protein-like n=1 Tax=Oryzias melastigma TaxID=30732 RepID=A0A3B3CDY6_ORYME